MWDERICSEVLAPWMAVVDGSFKHLLTSSRSWDLEESEFIYTERLQYFKARETTMVSDQRERKRWSHYVEMWNRVNIKKRNMRLNHVYGVAREARGVAHEARPFLPQSWPATERLSQLEHWQTV